MTEFSRRAGSSILRKSLKSIGYSGRMADTAIWSALWLQDRGMTRYAASGVSTLLIYMLLNHGKSIEQLKPYRHKDFNLAGICPFFMAKALIELEPAWLDRKTCAFGAPLHPILMGPLLIEHFAPKGFDVHIHHYDHKCIITPNGSQTTYDRVQAGLETRPNEESISFHDASTFDSYNEESTFFYDVFTFDTYSDDKIVSVELVPAQSEPVGKYDPVKTIDLPEPRLRGRGAMALGDTK